MVSLKIRSRSPKSNQLLTIPMLQYIKFGQNPSFGSRDRVQTSCVWSKFDFQSAGVTLKMRSRSPKSNHFFPTSNVVYMQVRSKSTYWFRRKECRHGSFSVFIVWRPWKLGQGHQNLLTIPVIQYIKFGQNPSFGSSDRVQTSCFWSKLVVLVWLWKRGKGRQKSNHLFPPSQ